MYSTLTLLDSEKIDVVPESPANRLLAIGAAGLALVAVSPIMMVVALLVWAIEGGPVIGRARRVGREGQLFDLYKFRTLRAGEDEKEGIVSRPDDPRLTRLGHLLRLLKLDELPTLVNVLRGDLALVGPRPQDPRTVAGYTPEQRQVLIVRPGLTSPGLLDRTIRKWERTSSRVPFDVYYHEVILPARLAVDLAYLRRRTVLTDLGVLLRTTGFLFR